jgi:SAM-dependent methyltransferase
MDMELILALAALTCLLLFVAGLRVSALVMTGQLALGPLRRRGTYRQSGFARRLWSPDWLHMTPLVDSLRRSSGYVSGVLLDNGCGHSPYRGLFPLVTRYVGLEREGQVTRPETVGDSVRLPFQDGAFDSVLATQMVEHVPDPWEALREMSRVLKPGGYLVLTAPQAWRLHGAPHDYYRFTRHGLTHLLASCGLEVVAVEAQGGVWALLGQTLLNMVPHRNLFPLTAPMVLIVNVVCALADRIWYDPYDTLNHLAVGRKP